MFLGVNWLRELVLRWLGMDALVKRVNMLERDVDEASKAYAFEAAALKKEAQYTQQKCDELVKALKAQAVKRAVPRYADFEASQSEVLNEFKEN